MSELLQVFIWIPLFGFLIGTIIPSKREKAISRMAIIVAGIHLAVAIIFITYWLLLDNTILNIKHLVLFKSEKVEIFINLYFDSNTAMFLFIGSLLTFLVLIFSRYYLHRDEGFKRYFITMLLFFTSYNLLIFGGNFETLFIGWEILGICSFLLIAFYRNRFLPVKNAMKVISFYRMGDICLILAMWMSHHLWHENITFMQLNDYELVSKHLNTYQGYATFIAVMIVVAATVKSAQLPFSAWLPRAMEGPTTSSAIFYGSLSVHIGVFLLLRTFPYWESIWSVRYLIIAIGLTTTFVASFIANVQPTVKVQIAYSSIAQIGLMFIEVALGFHTLALFHFASNAILRTYQLLVSPSVLGYFIHDMVFNFIPKNEVNTNKTILKLKNAIYLLSIKEWNLDSFFKQTLWNPFKWLGNIMNFMSNKIFIVILVISYGVGLYFVINPLTTNSILFNALPLIYSIFGLLIIIKVFVERDDALWAWTFSIAGQLHIILSVALLNQEFSQRFILYYLSGLTIAAIVGFICLIKIKRIDNDILLNKFHGYSYNQPFLGSCFLVCCLAVIGLPITPTFIGIDVLFSHIYKNQLYIIIFTSLSFVFIEISILRIYARIFMGQYKKNTHAIAYKSS